MKYKCLLFLAVLGFAPVACNIQEEDLSIPVDGEVIFYATNGDYPSSKTVLQEDGVVKWKPQDKISVFYGSSSFEFTSTNNQEALDVEFHGKLDGIEYTSNGDFWAVYPFKESNAFDGNSVTITLPAKQKAVADSFDDDLFISIAKTKDYNLQFYNVCGGVRFSVYQEGIDSVVFSGNNNEAIAGTAKVGWSDGKPIILDISEPRTSIVLSAPTGQKLQVGNWYYITAFPGDLTNGFRCTMYADGSACSKTLERSSSNKVTIKRSIWGVLEGVDEKGEVQSIVPKGNSIVYTSTTKSAIAFNNLSGVVSNKYLNGFGVIEFDSPLLSLDENAFAGNTLLETVLLPNGLESISTQAFMNCSSLRSVTIPDTVTKIEYGAFSGCSSLSSISVPNSVVDIEGNAFSGCKSLSTFRFPDGVTNISAGTLMNCTHLEYLFLPESLLGIDNYAFAGCSSLESLTIPSSVKFIGLAAFNKCTSLKSFDSPNASTDKRCIVVDGILYAFASHGLSSYHIPEGITSIYDGVFMDCSSLTRIVIPDTVDSIGASAFNRCSSLVDVNLPPLLSTVNDSSFYECSSLTEIKLSESVLTIGRYAFYSCSSLKNLTIPSSVLVLKGQAFYGCSSLSYINCLPSTAPKFGDDGYEREVFGNTNNVPIYVPYGSLDDYKAKWSSYASRINGFNGFVDLGLSVKWASCNIGASTPAEYGDYYAWGEVNTKEDYSWLTYRFRSSGSTYQDVMLSKYNCDSSHGSVDNKSLLQLNDDIAHISLDGNWRMPTSEELTELRTKCSWEWTSIDGVSGFKVTSTLPGYTEKWIFLPANGMCYDSSGAKYVGEEGHYWSSSLRESYDAINLRIGKYGSNLANYVESTQRFYGAAIRPVYCEPQVARAPVMPGLVDLGLSVKWSSFNLGATSPEESGYYYAWAETTPKSADWASYKYWKSGSWRSNDVQLTKYNYQSSNGTVDYLTALVPEDDASYCAFGTNWHTPTAIEWDELNENCKWEWTSFNGVNGYKVTSKKTGYTDKWIFLPASGGIEGIGVSRYGSEGYYWSSSLYGDGAGAKNAYVFDIYSSNTAIMSKERYKGYSIRPVYSENNAVATPDVVDLGLSVKWSSFNLGATRPEEYGNYYAWGETEKKGFYNWTTYKWCLASSRAFTKYNTSSSYGTVDNRTELEKGPNGDDVASKYLGGNWRMPTVYEIDELVNTSNCSWVWTSINGIKGYKVTSKKAGFTDKWIFLPAVGYASYYSYRYYGTDAFYWSSSLDSGYDWYAYGLYFNSSNIFRSNYDRDEAYFIRPVCDN